MRAATVGLLGNLEYTRELGKKSTESDVALYSYKEGDANVSVVAPIRYPEKPQSLAFTVNAAESLVVVVNAITKELGEQILAASAAGIDRGVFVLQNYLIPEQVKPLLKGTTLEHFEFIEDKPPAVRAHLAKFATKHREGAVRIPVDHHFHVKGIGAVVLGFVKQGSVKKHDELRAYPTAKKAAVRSIQVHDVDVDRAETGDHVGLALKNVENEDLDRGFVLAPDGTLEAAEAGKTVRIEVTVNPFFKAGVKTDAVYSLALGWQFVPCRVRSGSVAAGATGPIEVEVQKAIAFEKGARAVLWNLDQPGLRVAGYGLLQG